MGHESKYVALFLVGADCEDRLTHCDMRALILSHSKELRHNVASSLEPLLFIFHIAEHHKTCLDRSRIKLTVLTAHRRAVLPGQ